MHTKQKWFPLQKKKEKKSQSKGYTLIKKASGNPKRSIDGLKLISSEENKHCLFTLKLDRRQMSFEEFYAQNVAKQACGLYHGEVGFM